MIARCWCAFWGTVAGVFIVLTVAALTIRAWPTRNSSTEENDMRK